MEGRGVEQAPCPATGGVLRVHVAGDLIIDGGTWKLAESEDRHRIARITPPATPMFQQVVEYLETKPVPPGGNLRRDEESRAAVAVCVRWGSYFALLADSSRPAADKHPLIGPPRWSYTEQSRAVELSLRHGVPQNP